MPEMTIQLNGQTRAFGSKKEMLKQVGYQILSGFDEPMTLRQLYYRFVALDLIENKISQYQYLSEAVVEARLEGLIPWDWIEDRTRSTYAGDYNGGSVITPESRFRGNFDWFKETPGRFHRPRWEGQTHYIEVWVEKEALAGIFEGVCRSGDVKVTTFPSKGYTSVTYLKDAADRAKAAVADGKRAHILYFGDFDPSGQDIERNIDDTLNDTFGVNVDVDRIALTRAQIDEYELPPQPAKSSDSRYESFVAEHGNMAVELDALEPPVLRELIREGVDKYFDHDQYADIEGKQADDRATLREMIDDVLDE